MDVTQFPTILLYIHGAANSTISSISKGRPLAQNGLALLQAKAPSCKVINIPPLGVAATVSWIRHYLPRLKTDSRVTEVLHSFYERFDPGTKSSYELEAIASKYEGKEHKLYQSLEEKYGENPVMVFAQLHEGLSADGTSSYGFLGGLMDRIHEPSSSGELVLSVVLAMLFIMALVELPMPSVLSTLLPPKKEKAVLLIGACGTVGQGVLAAFREGGWRVVGVDPAFRGLMCYSGDDDDLAASIESVPDEWLLKILQKFQVIIYAADMGKRGRYHSLRGLNALNNRRFRFFCERCRHLLGSTARLNIVYIGGSWTKRMVVAADSMVVNDDSYNKVDPTVEYEIAKIEAEENAKQLAEELDICIAFFDWINVVPNQDPEFAIARMTSDAMIKRSIPYPVGDYGHPLLHTKDAGSLLMQYCDKYFLNETPFPDGSNFACVLVPGCFTEFSTFAEVVRMTLFELELEEKYGGDLASAGVVNTENSDRDDSVKPAILAEQKEGPPEHFRTRCESRICDELDFQPNEGLIRSGLRDSCIAAYNREKERDTHAAAI